MIFDTKKHLCVLAVSVVLSLMIAICMPVYDEALKYWFIIMGVGIANTGYCYWRYVEPRVNRVLLLFFGIMFWPIYTMVGTSLIIPTLLIDIYCLLIRRQRYYGRGVTEAFLNGQKSLEEVYTGNDIRVRQALKQSDRSILLMRSLMNIWLAFMIAAILCGYVLYIQTLELLPRLLYLSIFVLFIAVAYVIVKQIWLARINKELQFILQQYCDSELYCDIYQAILLKYKRQYDFVGEYLWGLRLHDNIEAIEEILEKYAKYYKQPTYLVSKSFVVMAKRDDNQVEKYYLDVKQMYEKFYRKSKLEIWKRNLIFLNSIKCIYDCHYQEALDIIETIKPTTLLEQVQIAYYKGICLRNLNRKDESQRQFVFVKEYGNTLAMKKEIIEKEWIDV